MRRKWAGDMSASVLICAFLVLGAINSCDCSRRTAQRRKDTSRGQYLPSPSVETLSELAEAMGAAGFEHYTEGKALVKRLIPENTEPDLEVISHQGVIGKAGVDFPAFPNIPPTGFNCRNVPTGYYADLETDCQVFHICDTSRKISFLCPNGTIFSQSHLICDWWFKVDCASSPALYESSAEYYSNEQKKTHKITQSLSKNPDLQQINSDATNVRAEKTSFRRPVTKESPVPSTTERFQRHRQRLQDNTPKATSRSFVYPETNYNPTQRTQGPLVPSGFEKRRKNLVQLIGNNFGNTNAPTARTTLPTYTDAATYRTAAPSYRTSAPRSDFNGLKEMQVAAESASFANNNNRQFLQDYNKNYRPVFSGPVFTPNVASRAGKAKTSPTLTTLFVHDIREKQENNFDATTKRPTLLPYTKSYTVTEKREPYTRPGVSLLKDFLEREKNKTQIAATTEKISSATDRVDRYPKNTFETATKIPQTTRSETYFTNTASSDRHDIYSTNNFNQISTEPTYQERRERLLKRLNLENFAPTEATIPTTGEDKQYGARPGLVVPPSLTPKTLHTLAIYYATALDNLSTTSAPEADAETTTPAIDDYEVMEDGLPALFSRHTINKYSKLFGNGVDNSDLLEEIKLDPNGTYNELAEDLSVMQSQNPLSSSPQIRELAQVFTHALSAYLQDPVQFRKVLSDIRPTQPSFAEIVTTTDDNVFNTEPTTTINEEDDEILGFSDENKARPAGLAQLREGKALSPSTVFPIYTDTEYSTTKIDTTEVSTTPEPTSPSTARSIFKCCGRISASYTTAASQIDVSTTPQPYLNTGASNVNTLANNISEIVTTTENSYTVPKYVGGFQNNSQVSNDSPYGSGFNPSGAKPLSEYVENTNLPTAWGIDTTDTTSGPVRNDDLNQFESKKIKPTTYSPFTTTQVYFTETDSVELENDEELQRAHSQSFLAPQENNVLRQGKTINFDTEIKQITLKKPSEDLEAPTIPDDTITTYSPHQTTTAIPTTTNKLEEETEASTTLTPEPSSFTSPDSDKTTNQFQWSSAFENWQSTVVLDPLTLNDGLAATGPQQALSQLSSQTTSWGAPSTQVPYTIVNLATTTADYTGTEQEYSSSQVFSQSTPATVNRVNVDDDKRKGRLLNPVTSTESNQDLTTIAETVVEKAKEIMGEMNATTTEKLMNVMKKTKSKTVRRLILLLVQTCDDDHNSTAEASKRALLEALMAVSQKDMDEIAKEHEDIDLPTTISDYDTNSYTNAHRRTDRVTETQEIRVPKRGRSGKSLNFDPSAINSLSNPVTTESSKTTTEAIAETTVSNTTPMPFSRTTPTLRRGARKFLVRTSPVETRVTKPPVDNPIAEARVAPNGAGVKGASDTRAIELLRSLYTIAARWG